MLMACCPHVSPSLTFNAVDSAKIEQMERKKRAPSQATPLRLPSSPSLKPKEERRDDDDADDDDDDDDDDSSSDSESDDGVRWLARLNRVRTFFKHPFSIELSYGDEVSMTFIYAAMLVVFITL